MEKPMKKQKTKQTERGITLIALVVTIIVLLILAGVSIQMLTGQTGILKNAQQAREETAKGQIKEAVQRDILEKMIVHQGDITADELYGILNNYFEDVPTPGEEEDNPWNEKDFPANFPELESKEGGYLFQLGDIYSGKLSGTDTKENTGEPLISETESYVGCYADLDGNIDNGPEGIIYADLAVEGSGRWNEDDWSDYEYEPKTGLKSYVEGEEVSSDKFNNVKAKVIKPKEGSTGEDRFYVMALEDVDDSSHYWYYNASGNLDNIVETSENDFGEGKKNTADMIKNWNLNGAEGSYGTQDENDMWGIIQDSDINTKYSDLNRWFVPSKSEWAAFGDMLWTKFEVTTSTYPDYNLKAWYWTSSQDNASLAYFASFGGGFISRFDVNLDYYVRLSTTF